ncbi:MAG: RnfABCDGE type electron transport complex subunit G [Methanosarcinaceae archaeon]|nr:RnfABCDGE type electron transport complex subunit G [Methanosarcinaceae archaeon]MDD4331913.1 RnfABCDGE type electron transport complex subunit G [Methanosarcinaceae archaeon]MDD4749168.1 RnfABCDGE type electron transport complex subunit G [Methanosarcinaceae archaeon]
MSDKKEIVDVILKMVVISAIAAALLGLTYGPTQSKLKELQAEQQKEALMEILPAAADFNEVTEGEDEEGNPIVLYYQGVDASGNIVGYAVRQEQVGCQGMIELMVGISADYASITGMQVMKHSETPGLGALIVEEDFRTQFIDIPVTDVSLQSKGGQVDAITGATISSQAVVDALHKAVDYVAAQEA